MQRVAILSISIGLLLAIGLSAPHASSQEVRTDQVLEQDRLVDYGYQFEIQRGGPDWELLTEQQIRMIVPEAIAGVFIPQTALYLAIIVEEAPAMGLSDTANLLMETMPLEEKTLDQYEALTLNQLPSVRYVIRGVIGGMNVRYGTILVNRSGFLYQIICFGMTEMTTADGSTFAPLWDSVQFLESSATPGRTGRPAAPDTRGVGWRVSEGTFESAAHALTVVPTLPGWRVSIGLELERSNPDAFVGLAHESPDIFISLVHERIVQLDRAAYQSQFEALMRGALFGATPSDAMEISIDHLPVTLSVVSSPGSHMPMDTAYGVFFHGDRAYQVIAYWLPGQAEVVRERLPQAFTQVHLLDQTEREALGRQLTASGDPQNTVGSDYSLRNGLYRDYQYRLTWQKPTGYWTITCGQGARRFNPFTRLLVEEPDLGVTAMLIVEPLDYMTAEQYHEMVLSAMLPTGHQALSTSPIVRPAAHGEFRGSWADLNVQGLDIRYFVTSTVADQRGIQLLIWGYPSNMESAGDTLWQVVDGLGIASEPLLATRLTPEGYRDERMGFRVRRPSPTWLIEEATPAGIESVATIIMMSENPQYGLMVLALNAYSEGQDERWFEQMVGTQLLDQFGSDLGITLGSSEVSSLSGHPSRITEASTADQSIRLLVHLLQRDHTFYAVVAYSQQGMGLPLPLLVNSFEFID